MSLRQEVMDFTTTYKNLSPTTQDQYYAEKAKEAARKRKEQEEIDRNVEADVEARRRQVEGGTTDRSGTPTAIPSPFTAAPPGTVTAPTAPAASTFATAFDADWPQVRRGGMIRRGPKRYADGGAVEPVDPSDSPPMLPKSDADSIVEEFLGPAQATTDKANRQIGAPQFHDPHGLGEPDTRDVRDTFESQGETLRQQEAARTAGAQQRDAQAFQASAPPIPNEKTSAAGRAVTGHLTPSIDAAATQSVNSKINTLVSEKQRIDPGIFGQTTPDQRAAVERRAREIDAEIAELNRTKEQIAYPQGPTPREDPVSALPSVAPGSYLPDESGMPTGSAPVRQPDGTYVPGASKEGPVVPPQGSADPPRAVQPALRLSSDPRVATGDPDPATALRPTSPYPTVALPDAPTGAPDKRSTQYGPGTEAPSPAVTPTAITPPVATAPAKPSATAGTSTPGGSATPAPPPGGASANAPSSARKEDPRTRTAAFEPGRERVDLATGATQARELDARGNVVYPSPQEMQQVIAGATTAMPSRGGDTVGNGAVSRENFRAFTDAHNPGGRFTKGQALMVGMTSRYKQLLAKGRVKEASAMAWGLIQAANLEAASFGEVAKDQLRRGDVTGATQSIVQGLDYTPDGMGHRAVPGGIETYDPKTGQVTASMKMDGQTALRIALGMSDGSMLWSALQKAAVLAAPPDKDAQGRGLRDELTRLRIAREQQRLAAGPGGGRGGRGAKAPAAKTEQEQELDKIYGAPPA